MEKENLYTDKGVPKYWFNVAPYIENVLKQELHPLLDPESGEPMDWEKLAKTLPIELAKQELNIGEYRDKEYIDVPEKIVKLYSEYRPTPLVRAEGLEKDLGLEKVKIYYKREDANRIGSYKLNSSFVQAYYAQKEGVELFVGDTGPGNWGMGMAFACKEFGLPAEIYMEKKNYDQKFDKVKMMEGFGAKVVPITTAEGTIAANLSVALRRVKENPKYKLSLGCLTAYSALHNTVLGMELKKQLEDQNIHPDALIGVVGGGSSFSGLVFPFIEKHKDILLLAIESASVPSFTKGEYRYENPDTSNLMPRAKMYTLGNEFVPKELGASGLNYHGKNPLLSQLVNYGAIKATSYEHKDVDPIQDYFEKVEGIRPAAESGYAIKGAMEQAKEWNGQEKTVVFSLTGNANSLEL
ncbi:MAG TPA: TrpB-like pyridoxal phosphate-dependent enzyme [Candidatus Parcubacteria bacterium]|nr:TrpB-like pyridoxal phosphate-dependent enzyme [Candidatus Parcubacteria bacterium]